MTFLKLLLLTTFCFNTYAYKPSFESLLRNGANVEVGKNTILANMLVTEVDPVSNQIISSEDGVVNTSAVKFVIFNEDEKRPELIQITHAGGNFKTSTMQRITQMRFASLRGIGFSDEQVESKIFYSLMNMLFLNRSEMLISLAKEIDPGVSRNNELFNREKLSLLRSYKNYLIANKNDEDSTLENPLRPNGEEARERASELSSQPFIKDDNFIKRQKIGDDFFYAAEGKNLKAKFDDNHNLLEMNLQTKLGQVALVLGNFIKMESGLIFPEYIWFTDLSGKKFEIKLKKFSMFQDNLNAHRKRVQRYKESIDENKITQDLIKPPFLL